MSIPQELCTGQVDIQSDVLSRLSEWSGIHGDNVSEKNNPKPQSQLMYFVII